MAETQTQVQTSQSTASFEDVIMEFDQQQAPSQESNFSKVQTSDKVLDNIEEEEEGKKEEGKKEEETTPSFETVVQQTIDKQEEEEEEEDGKQVNVSETPLFKAVNKLVEEGSMFLFDDKEDLSQYTEEELVELLKENDKFKLKENLQKEVEEFFGSLPDEIQLAAKYVADGGSDLRGLFKSLGEVHDIKSLDPKADSEVIVRSYYSTVGWGDEEISEKISTLKDLSPTAIEKEAAQVKPKLEKLKEAEIQKQTKAQEEIQKKRIEEGQSYITNATNVIKKGIIGEVKLDKQTQYDLYTGLTQPNFKSRRGVATNELGHLLEKYQYVEPDFEKMYKVLWLLKDEQSFFEKFTNKKVSETVEKTVRTLKTEQGKRVASSSTIEENDDSKVKRKVIKRQAASFMDGFNK